MVQPAMKKGTNRGGLSWAPIDVSPHAQAWMKFRHVNLSKSYKWSINNNLAEYMFYHLIERFDDVPTMAMGISI